MRAAAQRNGYLPTTGGMLVMSPMRVLPMFPTMGPGTGGRVGGMSGVGRDGDVEGESPQHGAVFVDVPPPDPDHPHACNFSISEHDAVNEHGGWNVVNVPLEWLESE